MEQNKTITENLLDWFKTCPVFEVKKKFLIDNLGVDPTQYAIFSTPSELSYSEYFSGKVLKPIQTLNFVLASRNYYSLEVMQNLSNIGFFEELQKWVIEQNIIKNLPLIEEGTTRNVTINNTLYLMQADEKTAQYQVQCSIVYRIN